MWHVQPINQTSEGNKSGFWFLISVQQCACSSDPCWGVRVILSTVLDARLRATLTGITRSQQSQVYSEKGHIHQPFNLLSIFLSRFSYLHLFLLWLWLGSFSFVTDLCSDFLFLIPSPLQSPSCPKHPCVWWLWFCCHYRARRRREQRETKPWTITGLLEDQAGRNAMARISSYLTLPLWPGHVPERQR